MFQCRGERPFVSLKEYDFGVGLEGAHSAIQTHRCSCGCLSCACSTGLADTLSVKQKISNELEQARSELRNVNSYISNLQSDIGLINEKITTVQNEMEASSPIPSTTNTIVEPFAL